MNFNKYHVSKNLWDINSWDGATAQRGTLERVTNGYKLTAISGDAYTMTYGSGAYSYSVIGDSEYTLSWTVDNPQIYGVVYIFTGTSVADTPLTTAVASSGSKTFTVPSGHNYVAFRLGVSTQGDSITYTNIMLNTGSQPLPYEPYSSEVWHDIPHYIHNTSTDTITTLPAVIHPTGTTATVGLKGNTLQSSIPSPTSPVMPQGTGERTGNLIAGMFPGSIGTTGGIAYSDQYVIYYVPVTAGETYTISGSYYVYAYYAVKPTAGISSAVDNERHFTSQGNTITVISGASWIGIRAPSGDTPMVNTGSTALPYEPWGIKIPISSASTATPVYLGEVETTRKIKKVVFNGTEPWVLSGTIVYINNTDTEKLSPLICTHFPNVTNTGMWNGNNWVFQVDISRLGMSGREAWITWLAEQYSAGTPVTVWYVLATETTGIVNEPLRKIGDYADEVSNISIPVTAGADTLSVDTTLQPSEVTVNYKGWHPVADVHEYEGGGTNLFDAEAAYGKMYNDGVVSGTPQNIYAVKNYFTSDEIGKQLTISVYAESVTSNRAEMFVFINGVRTTSNSINRGQQGTMTFTVIPTSTSDNWTITYGSGGDINSFSNLTVTEEPHWD